MKRALLTGAVTPLLGLPLARAIPPPPLLPTVRGSLLDPDSPVLFIAGTDRLMSISSGPLYAIREHLFRNPAVTLLRIEAHTDGGSDPAGSQRLSERRALAVVRWLIDHDIDCKRLIAVGFGATRPLAKAGTLAGHAQNPRIVFTVQPTPRPGSTAQPPEGGGQLAGDPCSIKKRDPLEVLRDE